jgi:aspartyl/asparaginyl-tRNA synthetase
VCWRSFADVVDDMNLAEDYVKYVIGYVLEHNRDPEKVPCLEPCNV